MRLVLGLGNPGTEYRGTRHNVGFDVVDELGSRLGIRIDRIRHRAEVGKGAIGTEPVLLAKPQTFMNLSGEAAKPLLAYHGMVPEDLIVVHDEADLETGTIRIKRGGGTAGHNGLKSLVAHLGTGDFARVRVGVGHPGGAGDLAGHVLKRPGSAAREAHERTISEAADAVEMLVEVGFDLAMRRFNRRDSSA